MPGSNYSDLLKFLQIATAEAIARSILEQAPTEPGRVGESSHVVEEREEALADRRHGAGSLVHRGDDTEEARYSSVARSPATSIAGTAVQCSPECDSFTDAGVAAGLKKRTS